MKIGVVGATGRSARHASDAGRTQLPVSQVASRLGRSAGTVDWNGSPITVEDASTADVSGLNIALFSSGAASSRILPRSLPRPERW